MPRAPKSKLSQHFETAKCVHVDADSRLDFRRQARIAVDMPVRLVPAGGPDDPFPGFGWWEIAHWA